MPYCDDMSIVCQHFIGDRIHEFLSIILCKVQFDQIRLFQGLAIDWVLVMFQQPSYDVFMIEYQALGSTDRGVEGLQAQGAEVEREPFEGRLTRSVGAYIRAG
jgi:hypothetical protein